jgi:hypothetical protein
MNIRALTVIRIFAAAAAVCMLLASETHMRTLAAGLSEYEVKAAFLVNFAKFIEWPASVFKSAEAPLTIAVVGDDPFGADLDDAIRGKLVAGRSMAVKRVEWRDDLTPFQMVFISTSERLRVKDIVRRLDGASVLTVSDLDSFCSSGGLIAFVNVGDRIRFEVNAEAAQRRGLKISSKLLTLATSVH